MGLSECYTDLEPRVERRMKIGILIGLLSLAGMCMMVLISFVLILLG